MKLLFALLIAVPALLAQVVEGVVINSATGAPIPGVQVIIARGFDPAYDTSTNAQGAFRMQVTEDDYIVTFKKSGFLDATSKAIHVAADSPADPLKIQMTPSATITGRVLDEAGNPVPGARITFSRDVVSRGVRVTVMGALQATKADERGAFSLISPPGAYRLCAQPPPDLKPPAAEGDRRRIWARTCYPSATMPELAETIDANQGGTLSGYEIKLRSVPVYRLSGIVLNPEGAPEPEVELTARGNGSEFRTVSAADGAFEFPSLPEGEWQISASSPNKDPEGPEYRALVVESVRAQDFERLTVRLQAPFTVRGNVYRETPDGLEPVTSGSVVFYRAAMPNSAAAAPSGTAGAEVVIAMARLPAISPVDESGAFTVSGLYPGAYHIDISGQVPAPYYLDSILLGDREVAGQNVELAESAPPIRIIYRANSGSISAEVQGCEKAAVAAIPKDQSLRQRGFVKGKAGDASKPVFIEGLRPGDYYVLALSQASARQAYEGMDQFIQQFASQAASATVRGGDIISVRVRCVQ